MFAIRCAPETARIGLLLIGLLSVQVHAHDPNEMDPYADLAARPGDLLMPLITDQTMSVMGNLFAREFAVNWMADPAYGDAVLVIRDHYAPRALLEIDVYAGDQLLFSTYLSPTTMFTLNTYCAAAVQTVHERLLALEIRQKLFH